jgi:hypothetical protein
MTRRRTGYDMVIDMMRQALIELERAAEDPHAAKARDIIDDALYLAEINRKALK